MQNNEFEEDNFCDLRNTKHFYSETEYSMSKTENKEHYCIE
jgi:hypothetical protein